MTRLIYKYVISLALSLVALPATGAEIFTHAVIKLPFQVQSENVWSEIIDSQEAWVQFYESNTPAYISEESDLRIPPSFDFERYTVIAGGLPASYSNSSLMIQSVIDTPSSVYVNALILVPGAECVLPGIIQWPTIVVLIPKPLGNVVIQARELVSDCE